MTCSKHNYDGTQLPSLRTMIDAIVESSPENYRAFYNALIDKIKGNENEAFSVTSNRSIQRLSTDICSYVQQLSIAASIKSQLIATVRQSLQEDLHQDSAKVQGENENETPVMENNPEMPNEDARNSLVLNDIENIYYKSVQIAAKARKDAFKADVFRSVIVDINQGSITQTVSDLNIAISNLKNQYYNNIVKYLKHINPDLIVEDFMYNDDLDLVTGYTKALNIFYNNLLDNSNYESQLLTGWYDINVANYDTDAALFHNALNSYVNLVYFDSQLQDAIGKVVTISNKSLKNIDTNASDLKYKFSTSDEHKRKDFRNSENRDALGDIAKYSKLLIEQIPYRSERTSTKRNITLIEFTQAVSSLFNQAFKSNDVELRNYLLCFHSNPRMYSELIFKKLLDNKYEKFKINHSGLSKFTTNVLESIAYALYSENGLASIDNTSLNQDFQKVAYSIMDCITGVMDRTMDINYIQNVFDSSQNAIIPQIKKKYQDRQSAYSKIRKINNAVLFRSQEQRTELYNTYQIKHLDQTSYKKYSVQIGNYTLTSTQSTNDILSTKGVSSFTLSSDQDRLTTVLDANNNLIDLTNLNTINKLLANADLNPTEKLFVDLLKFIDNYLGLKLYSENGLPIVQKLKENSATGKYLNSLLKDAFRVAVVDDLYRQYNLKKEVDSKYSFNNFLMQAYPPINTEFKESKDSLRFKVIGNIINLTPISIASTWIDEVNVAEAMVLGTFSKSTTKDFSGNALANSRTSFLGGNIHYYLNKYSQENTTVSPLLFVPTQSEKDTKRLASQGLITGYGMNQEVSTRTGIKEQVKKLKSNSLSYQSIVNNFYGSYYSEDPKLRHNVLIQPTTYSDKTSFVTYAINAGVKLNGEEGKSYAGKTLWELNTDEILDLYIDTIGQAYKNQFNTVMLDLKKVLPSLRNIISEGLQQTITEETIANASVQDINIYLQQITPDQLTDAAANLGLEIQEDTHYRKFNDKCRFNELIEWYANNLYNKATLKERMSEEQTKFVNTLLSTNTQFYLHYFNDPSGEHNNFVQQILKKEKVSNDWTNNGITLIIAKQNGQPIQLGQRVTGPVELNPILEKYFYLESLLANNLRLVLTASETAHPNKAKINFQQLFNRYGITQELFPNLYENGQVINKVSDLLWLKNELQRGNVPSDLYSEIMEAIEVSTQGTQLKRNVIIPATLQYVSPNNIKGPTSKIKVAVINDTQAPVYNFRGESTTEDAHDGSAYVNPFQALLENKALQDQEVGWDKKPIWHHFNPKLLSTTLLKFATFATTAERMRMSLNSDISLYNLFKKMTDLPWQNQDGSWNTRDRKEFNLCSTVFLGKDIDQLDFVNDILNERQLFYQSGDGTHYEIVGFGYENGAYYTEELKCIGNTSVRDTNTPTKVYHVFDSNGHHKYKEQIPVEVQQQLQSKQAYTINSLFQLYNALGGIYAKESVDDILTYSEIATEMVVNFMNVVSKFTGNPKADNFNQQSVYQPLKDMMIGYAANKSAVKVGAANINNSNAWFDNTRLKFMELDIDGLGVQMDADHVIDEAELTEMSQVIAALEAGGEEHSRAKLVYQALADLAIKSSQLEISTVADYIAHKNGLSATQVRSDLYDLLGRGILNNYTSRDERADMASSIIASIKNKFNIHDDHQFDEMLLPFSDNSLYNITISNLISSINQKSIKRKYPGSGCVMVPGYHIIQTYKYDGKVLMFDDVLDEARKNAIDIPKYFSGDASYNLQLVQEYLLTKQKELYNTNLSKDVSQFMPTDKVDIIINNDIEHPYILDLSNLTDYYAFKGYTKEDPIGLDPKIRENFIRKKFGINGDITSIDYCINITKPRDLAPAKIYWTNSDGTQTNIFDTEEVRNSFLTNESANIRRVKVRKLFNELDKGLYKGEPISNLHNEAAELVMSNLYASTFNTQGKSLAEILYNPKFGTIDTATARSDAFDLAFIKTNGRHTYISFKKPKGEARKVKWSRVKQITKNNTTELYAVNDQEEPLFKVGKYKKRSDLQYNGQQYITVKEHNVVENPNLTFDNSTGQVLEYVEYVSKYNVPTNDKKQRAITIYYINKEAIRKGLIINEKESASQHVYNQIKSILSNIYRSQNHQTIKLKTSLDAISGTILKSVLKDLNVNTRVRKLANTIADNISEEGLITKDKQKEINAAYKLDKEEIAKEMRVSFSKVLDYTASRIPAQTLQSFMKMKLVGWTQNTKNVAYVSHIQTWLQGSDYKQNCSL